MPPDLDLNAPTLRRAAIEAAQERRPFDLVIEDAVVLDVITGRERRADVGLMGPLIAQVRPAGREMAAKRRIGAGGRHLLPGFIDTHMHVESSMIAAPEYAAAVVARGVTTALWDPHELANAAGVAGVDYAIESARAASMRILVLAPSCVPSAPGYESCGGNLGPEEIASLLARDDIHGLAELMTMRPLLDGDPRADAIIMAARASGKRIHGHARGLSGGALAAYAAAGVTTDHELTSGADLIEKLEAGLTIELRGSHEHLLPEFVREFLALGHIPQSVTLCTDDVFPDDLMAGGGLDRLIRTLIAHGLPPAWVYRAATLNGAARIGRPDLGLVAPGRRADLVLMADLADVRVDTVIADGRVVAEGGAVRTSVDGGSVPPALSDTFDLAPIFPTDFELRASGPFARIVTLSKPRFPEWSERCVEVRNGVLMLPEGMIRMGVANRYGRRTPMRVAFLEHWGEWRGAFATSVSHDSHNLTVFGCDPADMAAAAESVRQMRGGLAVAENGQTVAALALPIGGLTSPASLAEVAGEFAVVRAAMDRIVDWYPPYLVFKACFGASLVCNPGPRLSDHGIVDPFVDVVRESCILQDGLAGDDPGT